MMQQIIEYYTYDDYKEWEGDWELIGGVAYAMAPSPVFNHQAIAYEISRILGNELNECNCYVLGKEDYVVDNHTVVRPDVVVVCQKFEINITMPPKLVVEVVSPNRAKRDEIDKFQIYEKEGVGYYILVYPEQKMVKVYKNIDGVYKKILSDDMRHEFDVQNCKAKIDFKKVFDRFS